VPQHDLTSDGERHAARRPIEQLRADFLLELRDLVRDRWLRDIAGARGAREMTMFGDGHERLQVGQIH
jgi:hypothetical protein